MERLKGDDYEMTRGQSRRKDFRKGQIIRL